jgi:hypothetical protein
MGKEGPFWIRPITGDGYGAISPGWRNWAAIPGAELRTKTAADAVRGRHTGRFPLSARLLEGRHAKCPDLVASRLCFRGGRKRRHHSGCAMAQASNATRWQVTSVTSRADDELGRPVSARNSPVIAWAVGKFSDGTSKCLFRNGGYWRWVSACRQTGSYANGGPFEAPLVVSLKTGNACPCPGDAQPRLGHKGQPLANARAMVQPLKMCRPTTRRRRAAGRHRRLVRRFTPRVSLDSPDGLFLDITGAAHVRRRGVLLTMVMQRIADQGPAGRAPLRARPLARLGPLSIAPSCRRAAKRKPQRRCPSWR